MVRCVHLLVLTSGVASGTAENMALLAVRAPELEYAKQAKQHLSLSKVEENWFFKKSPKKVENVVAIQGVETQTDVDRLEMAAVEKVTHRLYVQMDEVQQSHASDHHFISEHVVQFACDHSATCRGYVKNTDESFSIVELGIQTVLRVEHADLKIKKNRHDYTSSVDVNGTWRADSFKRGYWSSSEIVAQAACDQNDECTGYVQRAMDGHFALFFEGGHQVSVEKDWIQTIKIKEVAQPALVEADNNWLFGSKKVVEQVKEKLEDAEDGDIGEDVTKVSENVMNADEEVLAPNVYKRTHHEYTDFETVHDANWPSKAFKQTTVFDFEEAAQKACDNSDNCGGYVKRVRDSKFSTFENGGEHVISKKHDWIAEIKVKQDP